MRSPGAAFDLRAALSEELRAATVELDDATVRLKAVHRCRVRVKRARALARVGRVGAPGLAGVFNDTARGVMRTLAQARDLAALAEAARALGRKSDRKTARALDATAANLDALRIASPGLDIGAARAGLKDLLGLATVWPEASPRQIRRGARRVIKRARKARRASFHATDAAPRHEWRKREKDRFYAALLLDDAWPSVRRRKLAEKLGEVLGKEHDTLLLLEHLNAAPNLAGEAKAPVRAARALHKRCKRLARRADKLGARLHAHGA